MICRPCSVEVDLAAVWSCFPAAERNEKRHHAVKDFKTRFIQHRIAEQSRCSSRLSNGFVLDGGWVCHGRPRNAWGRRCSHCLTVGTWLTCLRLLCIPTKSECPGVALGGGGASTGGHMTCAAEQPTLTQRHFIPSFSLVSFTQSSSATVSVESLVELLLLSEVFPYLPSRYSAS